MADQPALVLEDDGVSHGEPVHFSGYPGLWIKGQPVAVSELGFDDDDAAFARAEELALPLTRTTVAAGEGAMPDMGGRAPSLDEVRGDKDWVPSPGSPGAALAPGEVFPPDPPRAEEEARLTESLLDLNAPDVVAAVAAVDDPAELETLAAAEKAGANRKTVAAAIKARQDELAAVTAAPAEPTEGGSLGGNA